MLGLPDRARVLCVYMLDGENFSFRGGLLVCRRLILVSSSTWQRTGIAVVGAVGPRMMKRLKGKN